MKGRRGIGGGKVVHVREKGRRVRGRGVEERECMGGGKERCLRGRECM